MPLTGPHIHQIWIQLRSSGIIALVHLKLPHRLSRSSVTTWSRSGRRFSMRHHIRTIPWFCWEYIQTCGGHKHYCATLWCKLEQPVSFIFKLWWVLVWLWIQTSKAQKWPDNLQVPSLLELTRQNIWSWFQMLNFTSSCLLEHSMTRSKEIIQNTRSPSM